MTLARADAQPVPVETVTITIDGTEVQVPKGTLLIRAAELMGVQIPRFCDHPLLDPVGACRQCLVEVEGQRKPMASCTTTATDGMVVHTQLTSDDAATAQRGVMELLLINHPLDCPICDKGGECPLQNQAMSTGRTDSRFEGVKRTFPKPIPLSSEILLDRERCVLCARCTRFAQQIAGDPFIDLMDRGAQQQVGIEPDVPFDSYFSGNTVQICPVGALTSASYRFRARPFDLVSTPSVCEHCADGCAQRTDHRRRKVTRRLAGDDPEVNEEWNCDKGRFAFTYATAADRITTPLIRDRAGHLVAASWSQALVVAARGLRAARGSVGVLAGGRLTLEDAYAYGKFARLALGTDNVDARARQHSDEETGFLATEVAGRRGDVRYADLESAATVLLVGVEPEEESPILFLRLRKAARTRGLTVLSVAPFASQGLTKMSGTLVPAVPGAEPTVVDGLHDRLSDPGAVVLVGERAAAVPGLLSAVRRLVAATGARLAWVPRRAGERGAIDAGLLPGVLPGGRPLSDPAARADIEHHWGAPVPEATGLSTDRMLAAAAAGDLAALVVGGVDPADLPDPALAIAALDAAEFVVSLEQRHSAVTDRADVVFPVAAAAEKAGTYVTWEGRERRFSATLDRPGILPDLRVLDALARELGSPIGLPDVDTARSELARVGDWTGPRPSVADTPAGPAHAPGAGHATLIGWRHLLDLGRLQDGEPNLAGTAPTAVARLSADTAAEIGCADGAVLVVTGPAGSVELPLRITDMPDRAVWVPINSIGSRIHVDLGCGLGHPVGIAPAGVAAVTR
ncbi:NADH-quinone oxidoreductase subunit G [Williamsia sterculiae]|uniref:NADH-quinone oxidoreductase n=1 Tax=Williamsia sterculiae TaxID=1344003 RepID=A0A1N7F7K4_9NOCA|nr:NADH-quinone oxidoreductase subunit G [Williamsia sterculiae]SIR96266.1 NADH dehydrogenase subunit G [Williamsia sterculiae]